MIRLAFDPSTGACDLVVDDDGLLAAGDPLETAVLISLFTDRLVTPAEVPEGVSRGGWWGGAFPYVAGDVEGSRLWSLLVRGREDRVALLAAADHAREALAWLLEDSLADVVGAVAERLDNGRIALDVTITLNGDSRTLRYEV